MLATANVMVSFEDNKIDRMTDRQAKQTATCNDNRNRQKQQRQTRNQIDERADRRTTTQTETDETGSMDHCVLYFLGDLFWIVLAVV